MARFQIITELTISGGKVKFWILGWWWVHPFNGASTRLVYQSQASAGNKARFSNKEILGDEYCIILHTFENLGNMDCPIDCLYFFVTTVSQLNPRYSIQVENSPTADELRMGWRHAATTASYWCESSAQHLHCTLDSLKNLRGNGGQKKDALTICSKKQFELGLSVRGILHGIVLVRPWLSSPSSTSSLLSLSYF